MHQVAMEPFAHQMWGIAQKKGLKTLLKK